MIINVRYAKKHRSNWLVRCEIWREVGMQHVELFVLFLFFGRMDYEKYGRWC